MTFKSVVKSIPGARRLHTAIRSKAIVESLTQLIAAHEAKIGELAVENDRLRVERAANQTLHDARVAEIDALCKAELQPYREKLAAMQTLIQASQIERDILLALPLNSVTETIDRHVSRLALTIENASDLQLRRLHEVGNEQASSIRLLSAGITALESAADAHFRNLSRRLLSTEPAAAAIDLYLDLLEDSLTGVIIEDGSQDPWSGGEYDPALRAVGRDWPQHAVTMIGKARMRNIRDLASQVIENKIPGDFIETGVWRGGACIYMRGIIAAAADVSRKVFVADSFQGLPAPDEETYPADIADQHHTYGALVVPLEEVKKNFQRYGLLDEQVIFLKGWFKDTLPNAQIEKLSLLRLDGDMYESTILALNSLYHKVSPGGFVIIDDYILKPCRAAVEDFRQLHKITNVLHEIDGAGAWWQV